MIQKKMKMMDMMITIETMNSFKMMMRMNHMMIVMIVILIRKRKTNDWWMIEKIENSF